QDHELVVIKTNNNIYGCTVDDSHQHIQYTFERVGIPDTKILNIAKEDKNIAAFLSFSRVYRWEVNEFEFFTEVRFTDLRYRSKGHYPFVAIAHIDYNDHVTNSYTGWIFSEGKLQKKLL